MPAPVAASIHGMQGGGAPLPDATREFFEPRFGADLSHVRVHAGTQAAQTATSISAKAFTFGSDIAFAGGAYAPASHQGQRLLAHELTHVLQQDGGQLQRAVVSRSRISPQEVLRTSSTPTRRSGSSTKKGSDGISHGVCPEPPR